jgi:hypothetical protein
LDAQFYIYICKLYAVYLLILILQNVRKNFIFSIFSTKVSFQIKGKNEGLMKLKKIIIKNKLLIT